MKIIRNQSIKIIFIFYRTIYNKYDISLVNLENKYLKYINIYILYIEIIL